jgi:hypothetical protein
LNPPLDDNDNDNDNDYDDYDNASIIAPNVILLSTIFFSHITDSTVYPQDEV